MAEENEKCTEFVSRKRKMIQSLYEIISFFLEKIKMYVLYLQLSVILGFHNMALRLIHSNFLRMNQNKQ